MSLERDDMFFRQFSDWYIGRHLYPHLIRHTTASMALERGMNVTDLQKMLGHEKLDTTMIYAKVAQESVRYSHHKYVS